MNDRGSPRQRGRVPLTLYAGAALIALSLFMLWLDMHLSGRGVIPPLPTESAPKAHPGAWAALAAWWAVHMTPIAWCGYLLLFEGILTKSAWQRGESGSCVRSRPWLFIVSYVSSVIVWSFFDWINFAFLDAWRYHGLPENPWDRYAGYWIAFAAISPGMFLAAQWYQKLGLRKLQFNIRTIGDRSWRWIRAAAFILGAAGTIWAIAAANPVGCLTLWVAPIFVLDPINEALGGPSILADWRAGRWGRTLSLMAGGATCGLCWEGWNYWAAAKWTYHLPFLGAAEHIRYFEMPLVGFLGFLPFGIECWVALVTIVIITGRVTEAWPSADDVL